jgi:hypothetical protein
MRENASFPPRFLSFSQAGIYTSRRIRDFGEQAGVSRRGSRGVLGARIVSFTPSRIQFKGETAKGEAVDDRFIAANRFRCSFALCRIT